ncbi:MAG: ATP-binding protein [Desulfobacterales bacterium]|nr:ATP-binding protein [Desulfobacterales bacterium]
MFEREIERKIEDFIELGFPRYIPRQDRLFMVDNMVSTVIGARRAGKSFRILQAAAELIAQQKVASINHVCYLDFDNPILSSMKAADLLLIQNTFLKLNPEIVPQTPLLFLLDEIHKIQGWEEYVIDLSRNPNWKVIVSGSSSKMLKHDIATELRGKAISTTVFPLSFSEYLQFHNFNHKIGSTKGLAEIRRLFDEYLKWGAYPALTALDAYLREGILREYFDTMLLKDIIQRYNVGKPQHCIRLYRYLLSNISKPYTLQSAYRYLKGCGLNTSREAVRNYLAWAKDSWLLFTIPIYSDSLKEQERNYKKLYAIDWALANKNSQIWNGSYSRALENMVYLALCRQWHRVQYYLTKRKRLEVDFVGVDSHGNPGIAVQVCMDISREATIQRELEALAKTAGYFGIKENLIITYNQEEDFSVAGIAIRAIPAWKWLLQDRSS